MWGRGGWNTPESPDFISYFEAEVPIFVSGDFLEPFCYLWLQTLSDQCVYQTVTENLRSDDERGLHKTHITPYGAEVWAPNAPRNL